MNSENGMNALMRAAYEEKKRLLEAFWGDTPEEGKKFLLSGFSGIGKELYENVANYMNSIGATTRYGKPIKASTIEEWRKHLGMPFTSMRRRHGSFITIGALLAWMWATGDAQSLKRRF